MAKDSLVVVDGDQRVPFLRGVITHSLLGRGLSFHDAYRIANLVRDRVRDLKVIDKKDLAGVVTEVVRQEYGETYLWEPSPVGDQLPTILVVTEESVAPFSKGILSQSLRSTGLDPPSVYRISRGIEMHLLGSKRREVLRSDLRKLVYQTLKDQSGSECSDRYLVWEYMKGHPRPLLILFGGATGVGKSTIAGEIAHRLGIQQFVSTDSIRQIMRMMFSEDLLPSIHVSSYEAWKRRIQQEEGQGRAVIEAFKDQSLRVLVGVKAMIQRAVTENLAQIIDGVHLVPGLVPEFTKRKEPFVFHVVLSVLDKRKFWERFRRRQQEAVDRPAEKYLDNFGSILEIQEFILNMARSSDAAVIENDDLDETVAMVLTQVTSALRERIELTREELAEQALESY